MKKLLPLFLVLFATFSGCAKKNNEEGESEKIYEEPHYNEVEDLHIHWDSLFNQLDDKYYAYVYSVTCTPCSYLREKVTSVAKTGEISIYFVFPSDDVPFTEDMDLALSSLGKEKVEDVYCYSTPTLIEITNKVVTLYSRDYNEINNILDSVGKKS